MVRREEHLAIVHWIALGLQGHSATQANAGIPRERSRARGRRRQPREGRALRSGRVPGHDHGDPTRAHGSRVCVREGEEEAREHYQAADEDGNLFSQTHAIREITIQRLRAHRGDEICREDNADLDAGQAQRASKPNR